MLPDELPRDLPTFIARFGTDEQCHAYLTQQRWPDGFCCRACGHRQAWRLGRRNIYECAACGQQHSLLKGTIFEQTKTGLAKWFLAIYLVSASKGGISALELQRQMGFGSYQTAWTWLHKIRRAMVRPGRAALTAQVEADETYVGSAEPGKPGRGGGKTVVAGAVESGRGKARGRRLGRLRLAVMPDVAATSLEGFVRQNVARPATVTTDGWAAMAAWPRRAIAMPRSTSAPHGATRRCACRRSTWCSASPSAGCSGPTTARSARSTSRPISTSSCSASTAAPPSPSATASPASSSMRSSSRPPPTAP
jgi:hypothetical protein